MTCMFSYPNSDHVMLFREFAFCLTRVIKVRSVHSRWKSKRMLATYMRRMRNNNLTYGQRSAMMMATFFEAVVNLVKGP